MTISDTPLVDFIWQELCEIPDRSSPEDQPDMALVCRNDLLCIMEDWNEREALRLSAIEQEQEPATHQARVAAWMLECFGPEITKDRIERADRFVEEALELAQSIGWTADRGHALVDYVFGRPVGEVGQEVGGVMVTLAALCNVFEIDIDAEAKREIDRITQPDIVLNIRAKQAAKPTGSALPIAVSPSVCEGKVTEEQSMNTAPLDRDILVWWPIVAIDEESGDLTDTEVDGRWLVTEWNGGSWLEPEVLNALNSNYFDDDCEYARAPKFWRDLPAALSQEGV